MPARVAVAPAAYSTPSRLKERTPRASRSRSVSLVRTLPVAGTSSAEVTTSALATGALL